MFERQLTLKIQSKLQYKYTAKTLTRRDGMEATKKGDLQREVDRVAVDAASATLYKRQIREQGKQVTRS